MAESIKFKKIGDSLNLLESEFFELTKNEIIQIFKSNPPSNINAFKKIEEQKPIVVALEANESIKYLYHPEPNSDNYVFYMWKPPSVTNFLTDEIIELLREKEPKNLNKNNKNPWIETWRLKP